MGRGAPGAALEFSYHRLHPVCDLPLHQPTPESGGTRPYRLVPTTGADH